MIKWTKWTKWHTHLFLKWDSTWMLVSNLSKTWLPFVTTFLDCRPTMLERADCSSRCCIAITVKVLWDAAPKGATTLINSCNGIKGHGLPCPDQGNIFIWWIIGSPLSSFPCWTDQSVVFIMLLISTWQWLEERDIFYFNTVIHHIGKRLGTAHSNKFIIYRDARNTEHR